MKGYKALSMDMKAVYGNGMQYEIGKLYSIEGEVIPCKNGYHFCTSIEELNGYYSIKDSRIFEIEADGKIIKNNNKYAAEKIELIRELTKEEINDYFRQNQEELIKSKDPDVRIAIAEQGYGLDILINDRNSNVRCAVAERGYGLDKLIHDKEWYIRCAVAKQGYGLDELINDADPDVRKAVVEQGYGLDILIHDKNPYVRSAVVQQGYGLDVLVYDENYRVRIAVAEQGYGLDILINDKNYNVRRAVRTILKSISYTYETDIYNDKKHKGDVDYERL